MGFQGPLFIIGLPRSGTKLLRGLLNQNPRIFIPIVETHYLPHFVNAYPDPLDEQRLAELFDAFRQTTFYENYLRLGTVLTVQQLIERVDTPTTWASLFKFLQIYYATQGKPERFEGIWGDKTPKYIYRIAELNRLYPQARFLHIIRDPRDYAVSVNRAWGKSVYRAAEEWRDGIEQARRNAQKVNGRYLEIRYEQLLQQPERTLKEVCHFLQCAFTPQMLTTSEAGSEDLGDTIGKTTIVQSNYNKYAAALTAAEVKRVEEIVLPVAQSLGLTLQNDVAFRPLSAFDKKRLKLTNGVHSLLYHVRGKGIWSGTRYFLRYMRETQ